MTKVSAVGMDDETVGLPARTIRTPVRHISARVIKRYSYIRRQELNHAAAALEPKFLKSVLVITPEDTDGATVN